MNVDYIRFSASDDVELQGWLSKCEGVTAAIHIHGMSGNGYENYFLDSLREVYSRHSISFFTIDTRGRGVISDFRQKDGWKHAGSCFEIFEESEYDIQGALDYLKSIGKTRFVLQGHSLGCTKVINYVVKNNSTGIEKVILLAPTDMVGWANTDPNNEAYTSKAKQLIKVGKATELVHAECWLDKTPISAQTYSSICQKGSPADIYGEQEGGALLGRVTVPMAIVYGAEDIGITEIDGTMDRWLARVHSIKNSNTSVTIINGSDHGFRDYEHKLCDAVEEFISTSFK